MAMQRGEGADPRRKANHSRVTQHIQINIQFHLADSSFIYPPAKGGTTCPGINVMISGEESLSLPPFHLLGRHILLPQLS